MGECFDCHGFKGMVSRHVLEDLSRRQRTTVLGDCCGQSPRLSKKNKTYLIVADEPDPRRLIIFIVRDHDVVSSHLEKVAFRGVYLATTGSCSDQDARGRTYLASIIPSGDGTPALGAAVASSTSASRSSSSISGISSRSGVSPTVAAVVEVIDTFPIALARS